MKDTITFASLLAAVLLGIVAVWLPPFHDRSEPKPPGPLATEKQEIRYIEPVTVIGHRGALADESVASAQPTPAETSATATIAQPSE